MKMCNSTSETTGHTRRRAARGGWDRSLAGCGDLLYMIVPHAFHARVTARSARRSGPVNGEAVASVVDAHVVELGTGVDSLPRPVDVGHVRARLVWPATTEGWECPLGRVPRTVAVRRFRSAWRSRGGLNVGFDYRGQCRVQRRRVNVIVHGLVDVAPAHERVAVGLQYPAHA